MPFRLTFPFALLLLIILTPGSGKAFTPLVSPPHAAILLPTAKKATPSGYDTDAAAYFAAIQSAGSSISTANKDAINAFITGCKADASPNSGVSNWAALKECCLLAGPADLTGALVPLKGSPPTNTNFVSGDYSRTTGLKFDASTKYLTAARDNSADPQNNNSNGIWITTANTTGGTYGNIGTSTTTSGSNGLTMSTGQLFIRSRCGSSSGPGSTSSPTGLLAISRSASTGYSLAWNGSVSTFSQASDGLAAGPIYVGRRSTSEITDARIACYFIGEAVDLTALSTRLTTLISALQ